jgi:squalene-associated FAD-dependent desaturase
VKVVVVGGGLAGCAAALDLVDAGTDVTLLEARPTLGGKVQTLPGGEGDPDPPPDNGQHIALGCFTTYLEFLDRIGSTHAVRRVPLRLPVIDERGRVAMIGYGLRSLLGFQHVSLRERVAILRLVSAAGRLAPDGRTFGELLRKEGQSQRAIDRFWDVFIRPALNLRSDEVDAAAALFTISTALRSGRAASDLVLPAAPLGELHGEAAHRALEAAGARVETGVRVERLEDVDADAVVVAVPPEESARLLGEEPPGLGHSPIVSVHLLFDRRILRHDLAALLGSPAHWVFDRGRLTGEEPAESQYLTVVSSGAPELMELRGRELVDVIAVELTERLGAAEVLWSRVSREPEATIALRPGIARPAAGTVRPGVARAGAWTAGPWPPTMENAVRSGRLAASVLLSGMTTKMVVV